MGDDRGQHAGQLQVLGVDRTSVDLGAAVFARNIVADQAEFSGILEAHVLRHDLVRSTFPDAAKRRASEPVELDPTIAALRAHLRRRAVVDGGVGASDVPVILLTHEPRLEERDGLRAHLQMFPGAALVLLESEWSKPLEDPGVLCLSVPATVTGVLTLVEQLRAALPGWSAGFAESKDARDREVRHLLLGAAPGVEFIPCGAPGLRGTPQV